MAAAPQQDPADVIFLGETGEEVRLGQRRNLVRQTLAFGLVANEAGLHIDALAFLNLDFLRQPGNFRVALDLLRNLRLQRGDFPFGIGTRLRRFAEIHRVHFLAGINEQVLRTVHFQHAQRALVERAKQRVIHQDVRAGHFDFEFYNRRSARRNDGRLHVVRRLRAGLRINRVKDFADHVERASEIRPAIAHVQADLLADFCGERPVAD